MRNTAEDGLTQAQVLLFRRKLMHWYRQYARELPWRNTSEPYHTWVSEIMLQQTRVTAVCGYYRRFIQIFPSLVSLALAPESEVIAAWSGLGYYRRARMLQKAAQFVLSRLGGQIPRTAVELRTLPGIGEYTCAAIASIAFGESICVVDGNVERVLLRVTGKPKDSSATGKAFVRRVAGMLVPHKRIGGGKNASGDHNQAMMELGATLCLPQRPLCLHCPVYDLCRTRGEHVTSGRKRQTSRPVAYLLETRKKGTTTQVLLERRADDATLMPGMLELPPLPLDEVKEREPILRLRHAITNTSYYVSIYGSTDDALRHALPIAAEALDWYSISQLSTLPLTGLARKALIRINLFSIAGPESPEVDLAGGHSMRGSRKNA